MSKLIVPVVVLSLSGLALNNGFAHTAPVHEAAAATKSVTVYADSEGEAMSKAEKANKGWKAISAKKVNPKDPISRQWRVKMER